VHRYLDSLDNKRIYYWLNCPGGDVVPTLALYDTMQYVRSKTATVCYGLCLGMGGFLLTAGGEKVRERRRLSALPASCIVERHMVAGCASTAYAGQ
jgi:ATP-dependent Clp protease protease subunit